MPKKNNEPQKSSSNFWSNLINPPHVETVFDRIEKRLEQQRKIEEQEQANSAYFFPHEELWGNPNATTQKNSDKEIHKTETKKSEKEVALDKLRERNRQEEFSFWKNYIQTSKKRRTTGYDSLTPTEMTLLKTGDNRLERKRKERLEERKQMIREWLMIAGFSAVGGIITMLGVKYALGATERTPPSISVYYTNNGKLRSIVAGTEEEKRKHCEMTSSSCKLIESAPEGVKACIQVAPDSVESKFWSTVITPENRTNTLQELQKLCFDFYPASQCQMGPVKTYCNTTKTESLGIPLSAVDGAPGVMP